MLRILANIILMITIILFVVINNQRVDVNIFLTKLNLSIAILFLTGVLSGIIFTGIFFIPKLLKLKGMLKEQTLKSNNDRNKLAGVYARTGTN